MRMSGYVQENRQRLRDRYRGVLVGTCVGDGLGAPFEGRRLVRPADVEAIFDRSDELRFTDDTHMTIGMAESLIACRGFDGEHMALTFARHYASEPWCGYGAGPPAIFHSIRNGAPWDEPARELFGGSGSFGNGAAMRAGPAALAVGARPGAAAKLARDTGAITHTHERGLEGAAMQAVAVALLIQRSASHRLDPVELLNELESHINNDAYAESIRRIRELLPHAEPAIIASRLGHGVAALDSVPAALYAFLQSPASFEETIRFAMRLGGDVDTIAAMAGALSGAYLGESAIPRGWIDRAERAEMLRELADGLLSLAEMRS